MSCYNLDYLERKAKYELNYFSSREASIKLLKESLIVRSNYDIFLSHSYLDAEVIIALKADIEDMGFTVYVDWVEDYEFNREKVTSENANIIRERMKICKALVFAFTINSKRSKWMPWELGFFDGYKDKVSVLPIMEESESTEEFQGQEYLGLYPYVTKDEGWINGYGYKETLWVNNENGPFDPFELWLE